MEYYSKAIELNPDYAEALINKAQLILDGERTIIDEMNSLGTSNADYDRYDVLKEEKNKLYSEALPYSRICLKTTSGFYGYCQNSKRNLRSFKHGYKRKRNENDIRAKLNSIFIFSKKSF